MRSAAHELETCSPMTCYGDNTSRILFVHHGSALAQSSTYLQILHQPSAAKLQSLQHIVNDHSERR